MRHALLAVFLLLAAPALAQAPPAPSSEQRRADLDRLFEDLRRAPDDIAAQAIENRIRTLWGQAISPALALLMRRGVRNLEANAPGEAVEDFDAVLALEPDIAEALVMRAEALARAGEPRQAAEDLRRALALEPRHFGARPAPAHARRRGAAARPSAARLRRGDLRLRPPGRRQRGAPRDGRGHHQDAILRAAGDEAGVHRVLPDRQPRAGGAPGLDDLRVGPRPGRDRGDEIEHQRFDDPVHGDPPQAARMAYGAQHIQSMVAAPRHRRGCPTRPTGVAGPRTSYSVNSP
jgi:tetratricopeptide (TPR) repeat protein